MLTAPGPATPLHGALVILPTTGGQVACPAQRFWLSDKGGWQLPDSTAPTAWEVFQPHSVPMAQDCDRVAWDIVWAVSHIHNTGSLWTVLCASHHLVMCSQCHGCGRSGPKCFQSCTSHHSTPEEHNSLQHRSVTLKNRAPSSFSYLLTRVCPGWATLPFLGPPCRVEEKGRCQGQGGMPGSPRIPSALLS